MTGDRSETRGVLAKCLGHPAGKAAGRPGFLQCCHPQQLEQRTASAAPHGAKAFAQVGHRPGRRVGGRGAWGVRYASPARLASPAARAPAPPRAAASTSDRLASRSNAAARSTSAAAPASERAADAPPGRYGVCPRGCLRAWGSPVAGGAKWLPGGASPVAWCWVAGCVVLRAVLVSRPPRPESEAICVPPSPASDPPPPRVVHHHRRQWRQCRRARPVRRQRRRPEMCPASSQGSECVLPITASERETRRYYPMPCVWFARRPRARMINSRRLESLRR
mmetsp:Transcript_53299/g.173273  ORF Transcript_53299/g.173273 Transcript_53299/m.173273 type:complete len:279 (+) Transcript_53299:525-1361(+)